MSLSFVFIAVEDILSNYIAISGLLAVMSMSTSILAFYPVLASRISPKFSKLWIAAEILLFVLVGAAVDIKFAYFAGLGVIFVLFISLLFRVTGVAISVLKTNLNTKERIFCMIAYIPKATVQAAIGSIPLSMGLPGGEIILTAAVISILITAPLGAIGIDSGYRKLLNPTKIKSNNNIPHDSVGEF